MKRSVFRPPSSPSVHQYQCNVAGRCHSLTARSLHPPPPRQGLVYMGAAMAEGKAASSAACHLKPAQPSISSISSNSFPSVAIEARYVLGAIAIGIGATMIMDLWNLFLKRVFNIASLNYCLLGRWLRHMPGGTLRHANIGATPPKPFECAVGWIAHYTIGVVFAIVFVGLASGAWLARPTLAPALLFGLATVVFPFFILQPSLGLGIAASRTPKPMQARLKSLATHTVFGVGLYLAALGVAYVMRVRG